MVSSIYILAFAIVAGVHGEFTDQEYTKSVFGVSSVVAAHNEEQTNTASNPCNDESQCVPISSCSTVNSVSRFEKLGNQCKNHLEKCCNIRDIITQPLAVSTNAAKCNNGSKCVLISSCSTRNSVLRFEKSISKCENSLEICCDILDIVSTEPPKCGFRNNIFKHKTQEGIQAQDIEFPWLVIIMEKKNQENPEYLCGGSLIHPSVVLSSAHNLNNPNNNKSSIIVRAGDWDIENTFESIAYQDADVESIVIHEHFYAKALWNDVSLLFLKEPFTISPNINPICLPPQDERFDNSRCIVSVGGKKTSDETGRFQRTLKYVEVPIVSHQECQNSLNSTNKLAYNFRLHDSFICAGGEEGKDSCRGDGGSPLICPLSNKEGYYYQAGIVSWGLGCGVPGVPGVYVKVSKFRLWIDRKLTERKLSTDSYTT